MTVYEAGTLLIGTDAGKPAVANPTVDAQRNVGTYYLALDTGKLYRYDGVAANLVGTIPSAAPSLHTTGNATVDGTLAVTGASSFTGIAAFSGTIRTSLTSVPTLAAQTGAGTTPPAPVLVAGGNDTAGQITWGTGTTAGAGDQVKATFGTAYIGKPKAIIVVPANAATAEKAPLYVTWTATDFTFGTNVAPADAQANTVYALTYFVIE